MINNSSINNAVYFGTIINNIIRWTQNSSFQTGRLEDICKHSMDFYCELNFKHKNCYVKSIEHRCSFIFFDISWNCCVNFSTLSSIHILMNFFLFGFELRRIPSPCDRKKIQMHRVNRVIQENIHLCCH